MQKYNDRNIDKQEDANIKICKLLNKTYSSSNILLSELIIICVHCARTRATIESGMIIDVSQCVLIVEHGVCAI